MDTPMLSQLMGAYFHPEWALDAEEDATVRLFLAEEPGSTAVISEIEHVLAAMPSEEAVRSYLLSLGSYFTPLADEGGYRGWLASIATRARDFERGGTTS